jgi:16S rRNA processing protein RimM
MAQEKRVLLGRIVGAHGIRGEVVIHSYAAVPEDIASYGALSDKDGKRQFKLSSVRAAAKGVVARIAGIADRNAAEALKGTELFVPRERLPEPPEADTYYVSDLVGMTAVDAQGAIVGVVVDAPNYGAGDLLEIRKAGSSQTELIPFTDAYVPEVDLAARRVVVRPVNYAEDDQQQAPPKSDGEQ